MKKILFSLTFSLFGTLTLFAQQNPTPILSMEIKTIFTDTLADGNPAIPASIVYQTHMLVSLTDVVNISKLHVKLGTTDGSGDLLTKTFDFDVSGNTGGGTTYSRTGYDIDLGLGDFTGLYKYYSSVQIERADHSLTDVIPFSR